MSAHIEEKSSRKQKKSKHTALEDPTTDGDVERPRKSKKVKGKTTHDSSEPVADIVHADTSTEAEHAVAAVRKKHKKRKHAEEHVPQPTDEPKRKKKRREREAIAEDSAASAGEEQETVVEDLKAEKRRKKKKDQVADGESEGEGTATSSTKARRKQAEEAKPPAGLSTPDHTPKKSKKDKKRRNDRVGEHDVALKEADPGSKIEKKKKHKHRSTSGFPDPTEDESLSEQAQKALHYAYTQFDDPEGWKFNKARQNWLVRNVWSLEAIPETFMPLVSRYMQGIQGGVRETLIKTCRDIMDSSTTATAEPAEKAQPLSKPTESQTEMTPKKTVKFVAEEPQKPDPTEDTKRQRAVTLLRALTSSTT